MIQNSADLSAEIEKHTLTQLLSAANAFYSKPENQQAFENWKKSKEDKQNENNINIWFNWRKSWQA